MLPTLALLAALAAPPAPDVPVSAPLYLNVPGNQTPLALASDTRNVLAVWKDERPARGLYAARVSPNGFAFDRAGVRIAPAVVSAAAVWNGSRYVILWFDGSSIYSCTFDNNSNVGDTRTIATGVVTGSHFAAFNGSSIAVVYSRGGGTEIAELDRDGSPPARVTSIAANAEKAAAAAPAVIAASGHDFVVSWIGANGSIGNVRLANGVSSVQPTASEAGPISNLSIASDGTNVISVFQKGSQVYSRLGTAAPVLLGDGDSAEVIWFDPIYVAVFANAGGIQTVRIAADGRSLDPEPVPYSAPGPNQHHLSPVSVWTGNLYVIWADDRLAPHSGNFDIVGRPSDGFATLISSSAPQQHTPDVGWGAQRFMTVWAEDRIDAGSDIFFARLSPDGTRLDGRGVRLSRSDDSAAKPHIVFDGTNFQAAWVETHNGVDSVVTNRVSPEGALLDSANIHQFNAESCIADLDLTIDGTVPLAVWSDCKTGQVFAGRITRGGIMASEMASAIPIVALARVSPDGVKAQRVSAAWNGQNFLVTWEDATTFTIQAARLTSSLLVLDPVPITIAPALEPSVGCIDGECLIAFSSLGRVFARHVSASGELSLGVFVGDGATPAVSRDSSRYLVAWAANGDLLARHVGRASEGAIEDTQTIIASEFPERNVALTPLNGGVAAVYERVAADRTYGGVYRTFFRTMMPASRVRGVSH